MLPRDPRRQMADHRTLRAVGPSSLLRNLCGRMNRHQTTSTVGAQAARTTSALICFRFCGRSFHPGSQRWSPRRIGQPTKRKQKAMTISSARPVVFSWVHWSPRCFGSLWGPSCSFNVIIVLFAPYWTGVLHDQMSRSIVGSPTPGCSDLNRFDTPRGLRN